MGNCLRTDSPSAYHTSTARLTFFRRPNVKLSYRTPRSTTIRTASSASSSRWKTRQTRDPFARSAKTAGLKSRAAFKLLELDQKHHLFSRGDTVVDLGYAPGSWSQVAVNRTAPGGRVVGIDVIPAQPPRGASSIQGDFLSEEVREEVRRYVRDEGMGRPRVRGSLAAGADGDQRLDATEDEVDEMERGMVDSTVEQAREGEAVPTSSALQRIGLKSSRRQSDQEEGRVVDVVLSDMSEPWQPMGGMHVRSFSNPYYRMMNTSGISFRDHTGSMDLCLAALSFCYDTLHTGGHFLCKFYQGAEDKAFEMRLKKLFERVHREKPESSRKDSKEGYFVALRRKADIERTLVFPQEAEETELT